MAAKPSADARCETPVQPPFPCVAAQFALCSKLLVLVAHVRGAALTPRATPPAAATELRNVPYSTRSKPLPTPPPPSRPSSQGAYAEPTSATFGMPFSSEMLICPSADTDSSVPFAPLRSERGDPEPGARYSRTPRAGRGRNPARSGLNREGSPLFASLSFVSQRITIWHTKQQRKIVGNAAPMAKNLQDYLDKHKDCEVYKGQDHPEEPKKVNPMEVRAATAIRFLSPHLVCRPCLRCV